MPTHQQIDERSLEMHRLIAEKLRRQPQLFERAKATLSRWRITVCASSQPYLREWEMLMAQGMEACLEMALNPSPHATALRQSSPFAGILTPQERFAFLKKWKQSHEAG